MQRRIHDSLRLLLRVFRSFFKRADKLEQQLDDLRTLVGVAAVRGRTTAPETPLAETELRVHSQFGEDGIIAHLVAHVPIERELFVEIGVEDYAESNTRFLLESQNWYGIAIDGGNRHVGFARRRGLLWRHSLDVISTFITAENINQVLVDTDAVGDIGLLSLDIDGVDYWVLDAIDVCRPRILVVEYNSAFGPHRAVTVPYRADFDRASAHHSHLYFGASLAAMCRAAERKGLQLVGSNRAGNNAFFIRQDLAAGFPAVSPSQAWVESRFREARDTRGRGTLQPTHTVAIAPLEGLPLIDVDSGVTTTVGTARTAIE